MKSFASQAPESGENPPGPATERVYEDRDRYSFVTDWQLPPPGVDDGPCLLVIGNGHLVQTAIGPVLQELPPGVADCLSRDVSCSQPD